MNIFLYMCDNWEITKRIATQNQSDKAMHALLILVQSNIIH